MQLSKARNDALEEMWIEHQEYKRDLKLHTSELKLKQTKDLSKDKHYVYLKEIVGAIDRVFTSLDQELKTFAEARYLGKDAKYLDWDEVAFNAGVTKPKAYKLRIKLMALTARELGWIAK